TPSRGSAIISHPDAGKTTLTEKLPLLGGSIDPRICSGQPCIKGTRIWVSLILNFLADDMTEVEPLDQYPGLTHQDVLAAIAYGPEAPRERVTPGPRRKPGVTNPA